MKTVLVVCLLLHCVYSSKYDCKPGVVTGISCPTLQDIIEEMEPVINKLSVKIQTTLKMATDTIASTRVLVNENMQNAKNLTNLKFLQIRDLLTQAKIEAARALPKIKTCILSQNLEFAKIRSSNFLSCSGNFTSVLEVRNNVLKLQQVLIQIEPLCKRMNPLATERLNLKQCLSKNIEDVEFQLILLEQQFTSNVKNVINFSTDCVVRETGKIYGKIGEIEGAIKNCKDVR